MNEWDDRLTQSEREALTSLARDLPPPPSLEKAVVAQLAARRLLRRRGKSRRLLLPILLPAGAVALFVAGVWIGGRVTARKPAFGGLARYMLFLEGGLDAPVGEEQARVREYSLWARGVAGRGHSISGDELAPQTWRLGGATEQAAAGDPVKGFFLIAARDDAEALEIARSCPHLRHGGWIVVRRISPT